MTTDDKSYTPQRELRDLADHYKLRRATSIRFLTLADHIDDLEKELTDARALLQTAVDAWDHPEIEGDSWRNATLSLAWRDAARKVLDNATAT